VATTSSRTSAADGSREPYTILWPFSAKRRPSAAPTLPVPIIATVSAATLCGPTPAAATAAAANNARSTIDITTFSFSL
jgi:hypothetical protein